MTILEQKIQVQNKRGLHARPASMIAKLLAKTSSFVYFTCKSKKVDAKQVMNLLLLEADEASEILIRVEGLDAASIMSQLVQVFKDRFGEE